jgi:hypothetical protein
MFLPYIHPELVYQNLQSQKHSLSPFGAAPSGREPLKAFLSEEGGAKRRKEWVF